MVNGARYTAYAARYVRAFKRGTRRAGTGVDDAAFFKRDLSVSAYVYKHDGLVCVIKATRQHCSNRISADKSRDAAAEYGRQTVTIPYMFGCVFRQIRRFGNAERAVFSRKMHYRSIADQRDLLNSAPFKARSMQHTGDQPGDRFVYLIGEHFRIAGVRIGEHYSAYYVRAMYFLGIQHRFRSKHTSIFK